MHFILALERKITGGVTYLNHLDPMIVVRYVLNSQIIGYTKEFPSVCMRSEKFVGSHKKMIIGSMICIYDCVTGLRKEDRLSNHVLLQWKVHASFKQLRLLTMYQ